MISVRRSEDRGHFNHGWLDTYHTFSFADYHDPRFMGFRSLRVINEDVVQPGQGFGRHPHHDMEIITYVLNGELAHRDSLGNGAVIRPGQVQYMAAGTGIEHSEFNPSSDAPVHLMQIWIRPSQRGMQPRYEERNFPHGAESGSFTLLASPSGERGSITINQDARLSATTLRAGQTARLAIAPGRGAWVQVLSGEAALNGELLRAGDGAGIESETALEFTAKSDTEMLVFDLA